jgi:hypothetical protein
MVHPFVSGHPSKYSTSVIEGTGAFNIACGRCTRQYNVVALGCDHVQAYLDQSCAYNFACTIYVESSIFAHFFYRNSIVILATTKKAAGLRPVKSLQIAAGLRPVKRLANRWVVKKLAICWRPTVNAGKRLTNCCRHSAGKNVVSTTRTAKQNVKHTYVCRLLEARDCCLGK